MDTREPSGIDRRDLLKGALASSLGLGSGWLAAADEPVIEKGPSDFRPRPSVVQRENEKPGSTDWQLTRVRLDKRDGYRSPWIEG